MHLQTIDTPSITRILRDNKVFGNFSGMIPKRGDVCAKIFRFGNGNLPGGFAALLLMMVLWPGGAVNGFVC
jgi:hypothetical protein